MTLKVHDRVTVCESHHEYGRQWMNKTGHIAVVTKKTVVVYMGDCNIHISKDKVVSG